MENKSCDLKWGRNMKGAILKNHQFLFGRIVWWEKEALTGWRRLIGKLKNALEEGSKSDLEKKIGRPFHEWYRWD